jgi:hypothetical protein
VARSLFAAPRGVQLNGTRLDEALLVGLKNQVAGQAAQLTAQAQASPPSHVSRAQPVNRPAWPRGKLHRRDGDVTAASPPQPSGSRTGPRFFNS